MKILILSVTAGFGHHATGKAMQDMLLAQGAQVETVDIYEYINRLVKQTIDKGYLFSSKHLQELYRLCYALAENRGSNDTSLSKFNIINIINALGTTKFSRVLQDFQPDAIICTHVFAAQLVNELKERGMVTAPTIGIVTDYTLHPYWEDVPRIEYIVTASELLTHRTVQRGIAVERILPFGIPIHPKFNQTLSLQDAREQLGLERSMPTILIMGGSMGHSDSKKIIAQLEEVGIRFQILAICGNNKRQYAQLTTLQQHYGGQCVLLPYRFVDNVEVMMSASDCIITKPGGLTVSEAFAKTLPMILVDPIPGHEERNVEFLVNNGIASLITKTFRVDEALYQLFTNPVRLKTVRENMRAIAHPDATQTLCNFVLSLGQLEHHPDPAAFQLADESSDFPTGEDYAAITTPEKT